MSVLLQIAGRWVDLFECSVFLFSLKDTAPFCICGFSSFWRSLWDYWRDFVEEVKNRSLGRGVERELHTLSMVCLWPWVLCQADGYRQLGFFCIETASIFLPRWCFWFVEGYNRNKRFCFDEPICCVCWCDLPAGFFQSMLFVLAALTDYQGWINLCVCVGWILEALHPWELVCACQKSGGSPWAAMRVWRNNS